jgi:hypothetical protein
MDDHADTDMTQPSHAPSIVDTTTMPAVRPQNRRAAYIAPTSRVPERVRELFSTDTAEIRRTAFGIDDDADDSQYALSTTQTVFIPDAVTDETTLFEAMSEREKRMQIEERWLSEQRIRLQTEKMLLEEQARRLRLEEELSHEKRERLAAERRAQKLTQQIASEKDRRIQAIQHLKALEDQLG